MASTFMGLSIATRGLAASQAGLTVTTNNMSNVNTPGYSRQVVTQIATGPAAVYSSNSYVGSGAEVTSVDRVRSFRLDQKYWQENSSLGEWETKSSYLGEIETIFSSTDDTTFSTIMDDFYTALNSVSTDPDSTSARATLVEAGSSICQYLNDASATLTQLRQDINSDIKVSVDEINSYTSQIADLNRQITIAASSGASTNELEDQRGVLIDELSSLIDIDVTEGEVNTLPDGTVINTLNISVGGSSLVTGNSARELECYTINDGSNQNGLYGVRWADTGGKFDSGETGALTAYFELRDGTGNGTDSKGIPYYISQLDDFAQTFAKAFNEGIYKDGVQYYEGHAGGVDLDGDTGIRFFSYTDSSGNIVSSATYEASTDLDALYTNLTAANITLSSDMSDLNNVAAASSSGEEGNNENVSDLILICQDTNMFDGGSPEDFYNSIIATLGTSSAYAERQASVQESIANYIDDSRSSVSGVSTDEETVNLTQYEAAYEASATMVSTWNSIYQTTINMVSSD